MRCINISILVPMFLAVFADPAPAATRWNDVDAAFGRPGTEMPGGVHRYGFPRSDLSVALDKTTIRPALALGSWVAMRDMGDHAEAMGDLVLTHDEVNAVLTSLLDAGVTVTALHNHLLRSSPATMYMHIHGMGEGVRLARSIKAALARSKTPLAPPSAPAPAAVPLGLDEAALDRIMGVAGKENGGTYQFSIPRAEPITEHGKPVPPSMGLGTAINFQPTGAGRAAITGDFVLLGSEVTPVLKALRVYGIEATALHNHLADETPRLFFLHFWAEDDSEKLAHGLAAALNRMNLRRSR